WSHRVYGPGCGGCVWDRGQSKHTPLFASCPGSMRHTLAAPSPRPLPRLPALPAAIANRRAWQSRRRGKYLSLPPAGQRVAGGTSAGCRWLAGSALPDASARSALAQAQRPAFVAQAVRSVPLAPPSNLAAVTGRSAKLESDSSKLTATFHLTCPALIRVVGRSPAAPHPQCAGSPYTGIDSPRGLRESPAHLAVGFLPGTVPGLAKFLGYRSHIASRGLPKRPAVTDAIHPG